MRLEEESARHAATIAATKKALPTARKAKQPPPPTSKASGKEKGGRLSAAELQAAAAEDRRKQQERMAVLFPPATGLPAEAVALVAPTIPKPPVPGMAVALSKQQMNPNAEPWMSPYDNQSAFGSGLVLPQSDLTNFERVKRQHYLQSSFPSAESDLLMRSILPLVWHTTSDTEFRRLCYMYKAFTREQGIRMRWYAEKVNQAIQERYDVAHPIPLSRTARIRPLVMEELFSFRAVLYGSPTTAPILRPEAEEQDRGGGIWDEVRHLSFYCFGAGMAVDIVCRCGTTVIQAVLGRSVTS